MCVPGCHEAVMSRISRRGLFKGGAAALAGAALLKPATARAQTGGFSRVVDLTHTTSPDFPTYLPDWKFAMEPVARFEEMGFNANRWSILEHTGTHMDAPIHFAAEGATADQIDPATLVLPLAVIDVKAQAAEDEDYQLTPDDIAAWEAEHGALPEGCCVAMNSGWAGRVATGNYRNADDDGVMHFPGFHVEAADMMMRERSVIGMAVDTLSLDQGASTTFDTHYAWLPSGRWGMENVAGLDDVPAVGATVVAGVTKVAGASGGPTRLLALV